MALDIRQLSVIRLLGATAALASLLSCNDINEPRPGAAVIPLAAAVSPAALAGSWQLQAPLPTGETLHGVDRVSLAEAWAVGDGGLILHTTDGGVTWTKQTSGTNQHSTPCASSTRRTDGR